MKKDMDLLTDELEVKLNEQIMAGVPKNQAMATCAAWLRRQGIGPIKAVKLLKRYQAKHHVSDEAVKNLAENKDLAEVAKQVSK